MHNNILTIIPARKGSKGLPSKNSKIIAGKPLISWTIEAALASKYLNEICISTDCEKIVSIAKDYGIIVKSLRPEVLAKDDTSSNEVVLYEMNNNAKADIVCMLQPTSPLRTTKDIDLAIEKFLKNESKTLVSVVESKHSPYWSFNIDNNNLKSLFPLEKINKRRQDLPVTYLLNGAIYIAQRDFFLKEKSFLNKTTTPYVMSQKNSIDIDDIEDFKLAEFELINRQHKN